MKIKELLKYFEPAQQIIICKSWHNELYNGKAKQVNPNDETINELEVQYIYTDLDLYSKGYIKIMVKKEN